MSPTLKNNDYVCIKKTKSFKQGDLIAFEYNNKLLVRRVIALSNDEVNIDTNGYVFVNDKKLEEDYLSSRKDNPLRDEAFPYIVPNGKVFVLGDNRRQSIDSRMRDLGCIDQKTNYWKSCHEGLSDYTLFYLLNKGENMTDFNILNKPGRKK